MASDPQNSSQLTWDRFCDQLKEAGRIILRPETPQNELDKAEGFRYLSRLTRLGLELCFELSDPDFPQFVHAWNATIKAGADNPDNHYLNAMIHGNREYRLRGRRGTTGPCDSRLWRTVMPPKVFWR